jgi:hypothetical protein
VSSGGQLAARAGKGVKRGRLWRVLRLWRVAGVSWHDRRHRGGLVQRGTRRGAAMGLLRFRDSHNVIGIIVTAINNK